MLLAYLKSIFNARPMAAIVHRLLLQRGKKQARERHLPLPQFAYGRISGKVKQT